MQRSKVSALTKMFLHPQIKFCGVLTEFKCMKNNSTRNIHTVCGIFTQTDSHRIVWNTRCAGGLRDYCQPQEDVRTNKGRNGMMACCAISALEPTCTAVCTTKMCLYVLYHDFHKSGSNSPLTISCILVISMLFVMPNDDPCTDLI